MADRRKFSLFISSTYTDLIEERQSLVGVALENGFIPVGMEQFHAAPTSQWNVITKMIDECDFYLLVIGGRYGSIDESADKSYTEKEYDYAKSKGMPVLVLIKKMESITADKQDVDDEKYDRYEKQRRLDAFRKRVKEEGNTVDFFSNIDDLKYIASPTLRNAIEYAGSDSGWVRYRDVVDIINEEVKGRNIALTESREHQQELLESMRTMLSDFGNRLDNIETNTLSKEELPSAISSDINKLFHVEDGTLYINTANRDSPVAPREDVGNIPIEPAFLLVYAANGDGRIIKIQTLESPTQIMTSGKTFMSDMSQRESARWVEALDKLISWGWVKPVGYKGEIFELTGTGYNKADWLKANMEINTDNDPLDELKEFE